MRFGDYIPERVCFERRDMFPDHSRSCSSTGSEGSTTVGMPPDLIYTVTEIYPDHVVSMATIRSPASPLACI